MFLQDTQAGLLPVVMSCLCSCVILYLTLLYVCYIWRVLLCGHFVTYWVYFMSVCGSRVLYSLASLCGRFVGVASVYMSHCVPLCSCSVFLFSLLCMPLVLLSDLLLICTSMWALADLWRSFQSPTEAQIQENPDSLVLLPCLFCSLATSWQALQSKQWHFITIWYNLYIHILTLL